MLLSDCQRKRGGNLGFNCTWPYLCHYSSENASWDRKGKIGDKISRHPDHKTTQEAEIMLQAFKERYVLVETRFPGPNDAFLMITAHYQALRYKDDKTRVVQGSIGAKEEEMRYLNWNLQRRMLPWSAFNLSKGHLLFASG